MSQNRFSCESSTLQRLTTTLPAVQISQIQAAVRARTHPSASALVRESLSILTYLASSKPALLRKLRKEIQESAVV